MRLISEVISAPHGGPVVGDLVCFLKRAARRGCGALVEVPSLISEGRGNGAVDHPLRIPIRKKLRDIQDSICRATARQVARLSRCRLRRGDAWPQQHAEAVLWKGEGIRMAMRKVDLSMQGLWCTTDLIGPGRAAKRRTDVGWRKSSFQLLSRRLVSCIGANQEQFPRQTAFCIQFQNPWVIRNTWSCGCQCAMS